MNLRRVLGVLLVCLFMFVLFSGVQFVFAETFGKTDVGGTEWGANRDIFGCLYTLTEAGTITEISAYIEARSANSDGKAAIYDTSFNLLAESNEISISTSFAWHNYTLNYEATADNYYIVLFTENTGMNIMYDSGDTNQFFYEDATYPTFPEPITPAGYRDYNASIYATYTPLVSDNAPTFSNVADDGVTEVGQDVTVSCYWEDDYSLDTCYLEHNSTGTFSNSSLSVSGMISWANDTITLNSTVNLVVSYRWFCSDNASQWNQTGYYNITTTDDYPAYSNVADDGVTQVGLNVNVSCLWTDNVGLSVCYLEHNSTGTAANTSLAVAGASSWANSTLQLNYTASVVVSYRWFCNDTNNQWNTTGYYNITTKSLYVTWNLNNSTMGSFFVDGSQKSNQTQEAFNYNQSVQLLGVVASSSYVWESFNWTGGSTASNSYSYFTDGNNTVWCMFDVAGTGTGTTEILYQGRGIIFVVFAIVLALSVIVVLGRKKLTS